MPPAYQDVFGRRCSTRHARELHHTRMRADLRMRAPPLAFDPQLHAGAPRGHRLRAQPAGGAARSCPPGGDGGPRCGASPPGGGRAALCWGAGAGGELQRACGGSATAVCAPPITSSPPLLLPQLRGLVAALQARAAQGGPGFGAPALPRHLRRRTASHNPRRHVKRPNAKKLQPKRQMVEQQQQGGAAGAAPDKAAAAAAAAAGGEGVGGPASGGGDAAVAAAPTTNRRMRRRAGLLRQRHERDAAWDEGGLEAGAGNSSSSSSTMPRRLETHVWHAKRLAMQQR